MRKPMQRIFAEYGVDATLVSAQGAQSVRILFRAVRSTTWQNVQPVVTPLGQIPQGRCVCLIPPQTDAQEGDALTVWGKTYLLRRVQEVGAFREMLGRWCLCVEKGG